MAIKGEGKMKIRCKNCKTFDRCKNDYSIFLDYTLKNYLNDCKDYIRKWWKIWAI